MLGPIMQRLRLRSRQPIRRLPRARLLLESLEDRALPAPLVWYNGINLPAPRANAAAVRFTDQSLLLLGGGTTAVDVLYAGGMSWFTSGFTLDVPRVSPGAAVTSEGTVLVYGGKASHAHATALSYNGSGFGATAPSMSTPRAQLAFTTDGSDPYAIGGVDATGTALASVETFSSDSGSWVTVSPMPVALYAASAANDGHGHIFVFGGVTATGTISSAVYRYDVGNDVWTQVASMPLGARDSTAVDAPNGRIYVIGGSSRGTSTLAVVQSYNPVANTWTIAPSLPYAVKDAASVIDSEGRMEVIGGINSSGNAILTVVKTQRLNVPDAAPVITSTPGKQADPGFAYTYQVTATGNPDPFFSIVAGPSGMTIDKQSGLLTWTPPASSSGQSFNVDIRATNFVGSVDQTYTLASVDTTPPTAPTNLMVTGVGQTTVSLQWTAATDNVGVASYEVYFVTSSGGGRGAHPVYNPIASGIPGTSYTVTGLQPDTSHTYVVTAFDAAGNKSAYSNSVVGTTTSVPFVVYFSNNGYEYPPSVVADFPINLFLRAGGNPAVFTYSVVSGPAGLTIDQTGLVSWTPTASQVGSTSATFSVTNSVGTTDVTVPITVNPDVPNLVVTINGPSGQSYGVVGTPMTLKVTDNSRQTSTFSIASGPSDMTVNPTTGLVQWTPSAADAGTTTVKFHAVNSAGATDDTVTFTTYASQPPADVLISSWNSGTPTISWIAPANGFNVTGYKVSANSSGGLPVNLDTHGTGTSVALTGLTPSEPYSVTVTPYDSAGNAGLSTSTYLYAFFANSPQISWAFNQANVIAGQPMTVQFSDANALPRTWSIASSSSGMTIDANGLMSWTPALANVGTDVTATVTATNSNGTQYVTLDFPVYFTDPTTNISASVSGNNFDATWTPPTSNAGQITGYQISLTWIVNGVTQIAFFNSAGTGTSYMLPIPLLGSIHYRLTVTAYDAAGDLGVPALPFDFTGP
jgi:Fibronectin type III domain/Kelch motif/Putative Ig domain